MKISFALSIAVLCLNTSSVLSMEAQYLEHHQKPKRFSNPLLEYMENPNEKILKDQEYPLRSSEAQDILKIFDRNPDKKDDLEEKLKAIINCESSYIRGDFLDMFWSIVLHQKHPSLENAFLKKMPEKSIFWKGDIRFHILESFGNNNEKDLEQFEGLSCRPHFMIKDYRPFTPAEILFWKNQTPHTYRYHQKVQEFLRKNEKLSSKKISRFLGCLFQNEGNPSSEEKKEIFKDHIKEEWVRSIQIDHDQNMSYPHIATKILKNYGESMTREDILPLWKHIMQGINSDLFISQEYQQIACVLKTGVMDYEEDIFPFYKKINQDYLKYSNFFLAAIFYKYKFHMTREDILPSWNFRINNRIRCSLSFIPVEDQEIRSYLTQEDLINSFRHLMSNGLFWNISSSMWSPITDREIIAAYQNPQIHPDSRQHLSHYIQSDRPDLWYLFGENIHGQVSQEEQKSLAHAMNAFQGLRENSPYIKEILNNPKFVFEDAALKAKDWVWEAELFDLYPSKYQQTFYKECMLDGVNLLIGHKVSPETKKPISTFWDTPHQEYGDYTAQKLSLKQLFVLLVELIEAQGDETTRQKEHVHAWLQETFLKDELFNHFKNDWKLEENEFKGNTIGEMLLKASNQDKSNALVDLVFGVWKEVENVQLKGGVQNISKFLVSLNKSWSHIKSEVMIDSKKPLFEFLFMILRGHNINAMDLKEQDRPRCSFGVFTDLLTAIGLVTKDETLKALTPMGCQ